jgi:hypothetical protein
MASRGGNERFKARWQPGPMPTEDEDDVERLLDTALEQTFPASDPIAVDITPHDASPPAGLNN